MSLLIYVLFSVVSAVGQWEGTHYFLQAHPLKQLDCAKGTRNIQTLLESAMTGLEKQSRLSAPCLSPFHPPPAGFLPPCPLPLPPCCPPPPCFPPPCLPSLTPLSPDLLLPAPPPPLSSLPCILPLYSWSLFHKCLLSPLRRGGHIQRCGCGKGAIDHKRCGCPPCMLGPAPAALPP